MIVIIGETIDKLWIYEYIIFIIITGNLIFEYIIFPKSTYNLCNT